jgi:hypothetical protein
MRAIPPARRFLRLAAPRTSTPYAFERISRSSSSVARPGSVPRRVEADRLRDRSTRYVLALLPAFSDLDCERRHGRHVNAACQVRANPAQASSSCSFHNPVTVCPDDNLFVFAAVPTGAGAYTLTMAPGDSPRLVMSSLGGSRSITVNADPQARQVPASFASRAAAGSSGVRGLPRIRAPLIPSAP